MAKNNIDDTFFDFVTTYWKGCQSDPSVPFNVIDIFSPSENALSRLIAWLLDPHASHGLGIMPLESLLRQLQIESIKHSLETGTVDVSNEVQTYTLADASQRRIDIVVTSKAGWTLGIENKPWAIDQDDQIKNYIQYLKSLKSDWHLIYLTLDGHAPTSVSVGHDEWQDLQRPKDGSRSCVSTAKYADLARWARDLSEESKHRNREKVAIFLQDISSYFDALYCGGVRNEIEEKKMVQLADKIIANKEWIDAGFEVANVLPRVKRKLKDQLREQIRGIAEKQDVLEFLVEDALKDKSYSNISFRKKGWKKYRIAYSFESGGGEDNLIFGIQREEVRKEKHDLYLENRIREIVNGPGEKYVSSAWWVAYGNYGTDCNLFNWRTNPEPWRRIAENDGLAQTLFTDAKNLFDKIAKEIDEAEGQP